MEEVGALFYAITWREVEKLERLLKHKLFSPNCKDNDGAPAIVHCIRFRNKLLEVPGRNGANEILKLLLTHGADVDQTDQYGWTASMWAAYNGSLDCLKTLVEFGADLIAADQYGKSAIVISTLQRHEDCVKYLERQISKQHRKEFENLTSKLSEATRTAYLLYCIENGELKRLKEFLVTKECIPNCRSVDGTPVLSYCLKCMPRYGKRHRAKQVVHDLLSLLIRCYVDVDLVDINGWTASMWAAKFGLLDCLTLLKDAGADFDLTNDDGDNCLMVSLKHDHCDCAGYLSSHTKDFNHQNKNGMTALMIAVGSDLSCLEAVLKVKGDTEGKGAQGYTALMLALQLDMCTQADTLLDYGADVNVIGLDMATPLGLALKAHTKHDLFGNLQELRRSTVLRLLDLKADPTLSPGDQKYLHSMLRTGNIDIVQKMILNGCQPLVVPCKVFASYNVTATPLEMAIRCNQEGAARFFLVNRFLTLKDIHVYRPLQRQLGFPLQNLPNGDGDTVYKTEEMGTIAEHQTKGPLTLYTLSFVIVSSALNQTETDFCVVNDTDCNTDTSSEDDEYENLDDDWFDYLDETNEEAIHRCEIDGFGNTDYNIVPMDDIDNCNENGIYSRGNINEGEDLGGQDCDYKLSITDGCSISANSEGVVRDTFRPTSAEEENKTLSNGQTLKGPVTINRFLSRKEKVELLPLPKPLQKALLFQTPTAYVDSAYWHHLTLDNI